MLPGWGVGMEGWRREKAKESSSSASAQPVSLFSLFSQMGFFFLSFLLQRCHSLAFPSILSLLQMPLLLFSLGCSLSQLFSNAPQCTSFSFSKAKGTGCLLFSTMSSSPLCMSHFSFFTFLLFLFFFSFLSRRCFLPFQEIYSSIQETSF